MLSTLRNQAGGLWAKLLLAFLILTFAVWGIEDILQNRSNSAAVAEVGSETITQPQLARAAEHELEAMRRVMGGNVSPELARSLGIHSQALNKMINSRLLVLEARRVGLRPSDEDVAANIRSNPSFQGENGRFNKEHFQALLRNAHISEMAYVDDIRRSIGDDILTHTIETSATPLVMQTAVETLYALRNEARTADLLILPLSAVAEPAKPDDTTLTEYYKAHQRDYVATETRILSYITLNRDELSQKQTVTTEAIEAAYSERLAEFKRPELRDVKQMLFGSREAAQKAHDLLKAGKSFADAAKTAQAQNLSKVELKTLPDTAHDSVFALRAGEFTTPVQSPFGWHIFKVESIEAAHQLSLADAREQITRELKASSADNTLNDVSAKLEDALAGGATMEEAVQPFGLKAVKVGPIDHEGNAADGSKAKNLPELENFLKTAFRLEEKTDSTIAAGKAGTLLIVRAESVQPEHVKPFDDVKAQVLNAWQKDTRATKLAELAQSNAAKLKTSPDALTAASGMGGSLISTGKVKRFSTETESKMALPAPLVTELFALSKGQASDAYALGSDRYAIAILRDVAPAGKPEGRDAAAIEEIRRSLAHDMESELLQQYIASLRKRYRVTVNEAVFEQMTAQP